MFDLCLLSGDLCFFPRQPLVKILATDAEYPRRFGLVSLRRRQNLANIIALDFRERWPLISLRSLLSSSPQTFRQIINRDLRVVRNDYRALNDVPELANAAGEIVRPQQSKRLS